MNNLEISRLLKSHPSTRNVFVSIHSSDTLPIEERSRKPCAYIANTDKSNEPGQHWVCFYFPQNDIPEYFDSYGVHPMRDFENFLKHKYIKSTKFVQHPLSTLCGQYTIFYILMRRNGYMMEDIVNIFDENNLEKNDKIVNEYVNRNFNSTVPIYDFDFIEKQLSGKLY